MEELERKSVEEFRRSEKMPVLLVLDNVRSMHNVGSIFRTADAFLAQAIFLCGYTPVPPHRDIHKTALGATDTVEWRYFPDAGIALAGLREKGYRIVAVEQVSDSIPLQAFRPEPGERLALLLGNEMEGVQPELLKFCDSATEIPQLGMKHSLNISVAAGIVLWELTRVHFKTSRNLTRHNIEP
jgi:23S rRNA (guanosine2251-2'-O)-methyltransferase